MANGVRTSNDVRTMIAFALVAGCGTSAGGNAPIVNLARPHIFDPRFPVPARSLADPDVAARLDHHVWVRRLGTAWLAARDPPLQGTSPGGDWFDVIDQTADRLRVVSTDDDARVGVWISRSDAQPVIIAPVELHPGVTLGPGAEIEVRRRRGNDVSVALIDRDLRVTGSVPASAIGVVWIGATPYEPPVTSGRPSLDVGARIHSAPSALAPTIAEVRGHVVLTADPPHGDWRAVNIQLRSVDIQGFARVEDFVTVTGGGRMNLDTSASEGPVIAAGTCLYDRANGSVIGATTRKQHRELEDVEWLRLYLHTPWGMARVVVHDLAPGSREPQLESCAR